MCRPSVVWRPARCRQTKKRHVSVKKGCRGRFGEMDSGASAGTWVVAGRARARWSRWTPMTGADLERRQRGATWIAFVEESPIERAVVTALDVERGRDRRDSRAATPSPASPPRLRASRPAVAAARRSSPSCASDAEPPPLISRPSAYLAARSVPPGRGARSWRPSPCGSRAHAPQQDRLGELAARPRGLDPRGGHRRVHPGVAHPPGDAGGDRVRARDAGRRSYLRERSRGHASPSGRRLGSTKPARRRLAFAHGAGLLPSGCAVSSTPRWPISIAPSRPRPPTPVRRAGNDVHYRAGRHGEADGELPPGYAAPTQRASTRSRAWGVA